MKPRSRTAGTVAISLVAVALLFGAYAGAYLAFTEKSDDGSSTNCIRWCKASWMQVLFTPVAIVESMLTGNNVHPIYLPSLVDN
jgi:hypothetical protein